MNPNLRYIGNEANFLKNIGFRIQFFRKKSGLSQEELAEKSGLSYSTISHIESSTPFPMSVSYTHLDVYKRQFISGPHLLSSIITKN